jgi:hypothetical protein
MARWQLGRGEGTKINNQLKARTMMTATTITIETKGTAVALKARLQRGGSGQLGGGGVSVGGSFFVGGGRISWLGIFLGA